MISKKIKTVIYIGVLLWVVAFVQMGMTRIMYRDINISQAYAGNQMELVSGSVEMKAKSEDKVIDRKAWKKEFGTTMTAKSLTVNHINYLHVKTKKNMSIREIRDIKEKLGYLLERYQIRDYELITLTECRYNGEMTGEEKQELVRKLFRHSGAMTVTASEKEGYFSAYGYTLGEADSVMVNGKKTNINIVIRYNEESGTSSIIIGTPYINTDY